MVVFTSYFIKFRFWAIYICAYSLQRKPVVVYY
jgi:hypothetical protein